MRIRTLLLVHAIAATAKPRTADSYANITGVPLWGQQHYVNGYRCADGTIIPRARVNDDACDCVDGGDEPGTAACAGRQQFFWCAADRRFIPSSRVGDGVVDCCDGADEAMRVAPPTGPRLMPRCPASHAVWKSTSESGAPDNPSLSHFSAMAWPCWFRRAVRNRYRHAIEQASRRWRGGRRGDSARAVKF
jgi:hypothetical protein